MFEISLGDWLEGTVYLVDISGIREEQWTTEERKR